MPTLLPNDDLTLNWFPEGFDREEAFALVDRVNQRAAEALARPVEVEWLGQVAGTIHGLVVMVLGRPWATLMFHVPHDKPVVGCCGLANKGAVVEWHAGQLDNARRRLSSPGELIELLFSPESSGPSYSQWASEVLKEYLDERGRTVPALNMAEARSGLARLYRETCKALEQALPIATLRKTLSLHVVGDPALVAFLDCLAAHRLLHERPLVRRLLDDHTNAARLWTAVADSHERLAPLLLASLPHLAPIDAKASVLLRRIGIGKGLSGRLRKLRADQVPMLLDTVDMCRNIDLTVTFFRHLGTAWSRIDDQPGGSARLQEQRLEFLFALCKISARLDRWAAQGWPGLPQRAVGMVNLYPPGRPGFDPDIEDDRLSPLIPFTTLERLLNAVLAALCQAASRADLERIRSRLDHIVDWLGHAADTRIEIPPRASLHWFYQQADAWVATTELASIPDIVWPCALLAHAEEWRTAELAVTGGLRVVPLASTAALTEESLHMYHCVAVAYWSKAAHGSTRLFSIEELGRKFATLELTFHGKWQCQQLKGQVNQELIQHMEDRNSPLGRLVHELTGFYNQQQPTAYASVLGDTKTGDGVPLELDIPALVRRVA